MNANQNANSIPSIYEQLFNIANKESKVEEKEVTSQKETTQTNAKQGAPNFPFKFKENNPKNGNLAKKWRERYDLLVEFKQKFGHANVTRVTKGYELLGFWVADQRRKCRAGKLTEEQFRLLNDIGMEWDRSYYFKPRVVVKKTS